MKNIIISLFFFKVLLFAECVKIDSNFTQNYALKFSTFAKSDLNLTLQDAQKLNFTQSDSSNFGKGLFAVWAKINICNNTTEEKEVFLTNLRAGVDEIDVYVLYGTKIKLFLLGDSKANSLRDTIDRFSSFSVIIPAEQNISILAKQVNYHGPVEANWLIQSNAEFVKTRFYDTLFWGIFIGMMCALIMYNISMFFAIKRAEFIFYGGLGLFSILSQLQISGILHAIAPDCLVNNINELSFFSVMLSITCAIVFNFYFFDIEKNFPKLKNIFYALLLIYITLLVIGFANLTLTVEYLFQTTILVTLTLLLLLIIGFIAGRKQISGSYFYLIGQGILFLTYIVATISINSKAQITVWTYLAIPIAILIEMIFLSFALSSRVKQINTLKQKQEKLITFFAHINNVSGMLNSVLHQWKKPIERLGAIFTGIEIAIAYNKDPLAKLNENITNINSNLSILQNTTQEFYNLHNNTDNKENIDIYYEIKQIETILMQNANVYAKLNYQDIKNIKLKTYKQAIFHLFFILINNALEVAAKRNIDNAAITISHKYYDDNIELTIADNCGGIKQTPIESVFDINISDDISDKAIKGSGLAIAKMLVEDRLNGQITVINNLNGASFIVKLKI